MTELPTGRGTAPVWWDDAPTALRLATRPLTEDVRVRTVVIGAGISGAFVARELARLGDPPLLLEATRPGDGATGRNAGFLLAESECFGLAERRHGAATARLLRNAGLVTRQLVIEVAGSGSRGLGLRWPGSVRLAEDDDETDAFRRSAAAVPELRLSPSPNAVPEAGRGAQPYTSALVDPGDGVVQPLRLLARTLDDAGTRGVVRHDATPVRALHRVGRRLEVVTPHAVVRTERVVLATNAALRLLVRAASPIRPVRAQALVAHVAPAPRWRRPVYATRGGDYWRTLPGGRVLLGGLRRLQRRAENTRAARPTARLQGGLDVLLRRLVGPDAVLEVTHRWAGTMAFTPDGLPWVGALPGHPGVHVLAGMNGHGMGWAPGLARTLALHLAGGGPSPPPVLRPRP